MTTPPRKNIVAANAVLADSGFIELSAEDMKAQWQWARISNEVKEVKMLQGQFLETVRTNKLLVLEKKK